MAINMPVRSMGRELGNTSMFGGNTGRQGIFDPEDQAQASEALQRLMDLQNTYGDTLRYGYSGKTNVRPGDSMGYAKYQNAITEADNIARTLGGQDPRSIKSGGQTNRSPVLGLGTLPGQQAPLQGAASIQGNAPMQGLNKAMPESHQNFMNRYGRG